MSEPQSPAPRPCAECGTPPSPGQSFCDGCGAVLQWTPPASVPAPTAAPTPAAAPAPPSTPPSAPPSVPAPAAPGFGKVSPSVPTYAEVSSGLLGAKPVADTPVAPVPAPAAQAAAQAAAGAEDDTVPNRPVANEPPPADPAFGGRPPAEQLGQSASDRARALLVPVADPDQRVPEAWSVAPVLPARPVASRLLVKGPDTGLEVEGGIPCPWCGTGNHADRHFCRRCAMPMAGSAADAGRRPWWRRLLDFRNRPAPWAGDRPRLRRGFGRLLNWVVGAVILALLVTAAFNVGTAVHAVGNHFAKRVLIEPDSESASHSYSGHGPQLAFDEISNTWWGPGISGSGQGEWLQANFQQPVQLLNLVITPGVSAEPDQLSQSALPHVIQAVITTSDGGTSTRNITLDQGGVQTRSFEANNVTSVRFVLQSAYGESASTQVAIAEIEFFGPSSGSWLR